MTVLSAPTRPLHQLDAVRHGLVDVAGGCRDLDAVLDAARAAEAEGVDAVVVPAATGHWPATAQALAVLLATTRVRVVLPVDADTRPDPVALARFTDSAVRLAGDRLVVQVAGTAADELADTLRRRSLGDVVVGTTGLDAVA